MRRRSFRLCIVGLLAAAMGSFAGCGRSDRASVHGILTHKDGTPVTGARVVARSSESGATAYGTTDQRGFFEIQGGLANGNYNVSILEDLGDPDNRRLPTIAARYREPAQSGIKVDAVQGEAVELNLTLDPP